MRDVRRVYNDKQGNESNLAGSILVSQDQKDDLIFIRIFFQRHTTFVEKKKAFLVLALLTASFHWQDWVLVSTSQLCFVSSNDRFEQIRLVVTTLFMTKTSKIIAGPYIDIVSDVSNGDLTIVHNNFLDCFKQKM